MAKKTLPPYLALVSSQTKPETSLQREQREDRELLARRGVGIGPVSKQFLDGMRLGLELLQEGESVEDPKASLNREFRDGPQINFVLPFLKRLHAHDNPEFKAGFAAILSDCIQNALQYNDSEYVESLVEGAQISQNA